MTRRKLALNTRKYQLELAIDSPDGLDPIDDYREVNFDLPGKGRRRGVFFLLPDKNSNDPTATKPPGEWNVPVRWDDPTMLYVPTLRDESILDALRYILDSELENEALENMED